MAAGAPPSGGMKVLATFLVVALIIFGVYLAFSDGGDEQPAQDVRLAEPVVDRDDTVSRDAIDLPTTVFVSSDTRPRPEQAEVEKLKAQVVAYELALQALKDQGEQSNAQLAAYRQRYDRGPERDLSSPMLLDMPEPAGSSLLGGLGWGDTAGAAAGQAAAAGCDDEYLKKYGQVFALPAGVIVAAKMENAMVTAGNNVPAVATFPAEVEVRGHVIPAGTRLIGEGTADPSIDRIIVAFDKLVLPCGQEHAIDAMAMAPDGSLGIASAVQSEVGQQMFMSFLSSFASGAANAFNLRENYSTDNNANGVYLIPQPGRAVQGAAYAGASTAAERLSGYFQDRAESAVKVITADANTPFRVYFRTGVSREEQ